MTTVQQVIERAIGRSVANALPALTDNVPVVVARLNDFQQALWRAVAAVSRTAFQASADLASTVAAARRTVDLDAAPSRVGRLLRVELADGPLVGAEVVRVDLASPEAEWGPRFLVERRTLREVADSWGAPGGAVALRLTYVERPPALDVAGAASQAVWVEDDFAFLLVNRLAHDLARADVGRDEAELTALDAEYADGVAAYLDSLQLRPGARAVGTVVPDADDTDG